MSLLENVQHPVRTVLAAVALAAVPLATVAVPAHSAPLRTERGAGCPVVHGSLPEARSSTGIAKVTDVRTGRHACFDRLVIDLAGTATGYRVRYVPAVSHDGSGTPVPVRGGARIEIIVMAPAYDDAGRSTYRPADPRELTDVRGFGAFRQVASAGSFEGQTTLALGVRARLPFDAFTIAGPGNTTRLVLDVAHRW